MFNKIINSNNKKQINPQKYVVWYLLITTGLCAFSVNAVTAKNEKHANNKAVEKNLGLEVSFKANAEKKFLLSADYYYFGTPTNAKRSAGVIILHDCKSDRSRYTALARKIADQNIHVLSLDFRGYGDSTAIGFSQRVIKEQSGDIISYQSEIALLTSYWPDDVTSAYNFLRTKVDKSQGIAIVASGCAASYAVSLAEKTRLSAMVLLTPKVSHADKERYKNLIDIPTYFISSFHDLMSYNAAQELFVWSGDKNSKIQTFKGTRQGKQLISGRLNLIADITLWLKSNLK